MTESTLEHDLIQHLIQTLQYDRYIGGPELLESGMRESDTDPVLWGVVRESLERLNPHATPVAIDEALRMLQGIQMQDIAEANEEFHRYLVGGLSVEYISEAGREGVLIRLVDWERVEDNTLIVSSQVTIRGLRVRRPDVIIYLNGFPVVVFEVKSALGEEATIEMAFHQLQTYKREISQLFVWNALLVVSDGFEARYGSLTSSWDRFMVWKSKDGQQDARKTQPELYVLLDGLFVQSVFFDLLESFVVFEKEEKKDPESGLTTITRVKKIAAYHQYYAVKKAVKTTQEAVSESGDRRAGVVWHTQGSGKSLSMLFYAGLLIRELDNPTIVVVTDRNDLDEQLYGTFWKGRALLRQEPTQVENTEDLKDVLVRSGGGVIFTTIQKFSDRENLDEFERLSERRNIVVIADEAHRSQYGFKAKTGYIRDESKQVIGRQTSYGFAKYLRDALPNASFIGFTGTPIDKQDASTPAVFGNYIDVYDIKQAVEDQATVPIYYESRLVQLAFDPSVQEELDQTVEVISESEEISLSEKAKAKWTQMEAVVGHKSRLRAVAQDIVDHYERRSEVTVGKGMIVAMSRRIAVELYDQIINLRPEWHSDDLDKGAIKVVMTSSASDPLTWQAHSTSKLEKKDLANRVKDVNDPLKLVIVRDMWLTGFDAPCLHTLYVDKPMRGHNLMQAIARVNRKYKDKKGGLVVDYIGILTDLKEAMNIYSQAGGQGNPVDELREAVEVMKMKLEIVSQMFYGFEYQGYFGAEPSEKLELILEAEEWILGLEDGEKRFIQEVTELSKAYSLCSSTLDGFEVRDEIAFFQAVKVRLQKFRSTGAGMSFGEIDSVIRQLVDRAIVTEGIVDVFEAAGMQRPDISILSEEFLAEVREMKRKNLATELLRKLLQNEIKVSFKTNFVKEKKFSEKLQEAIRRYQNQMLTSTEIIQELMDIARDLREDLAKASQTGLEAEELAFYDALAENASAVEVLGDEVLAVLAQDLVQKVKQNVTIDWSQREAVKAKLRRMIRNTLRKFGYPPDLEKAATELILKQSELFAEYHIEEVRG